MNVIDFFPSRKISIWKQIVPLFYFSTLSSILYIILVFFLNPHPRIGRKGEREGAKKRERERAILM